MRYGTKFRRQFKVTAIVNDLSQLPFKIVKLPVNGGLKSILIDCISVLQSATENRNSHWKSRSKLLLSFKGSKPRKGISSVTRKKLDGGEEIGKLALRERGEGDEGQNKSRKNLVPVSNKTRLKK